MSKYKRSKKVMELGTLRERVNKNSIIIEYIIYNLCIQMY